MTDQAALKERAIEKACDADSCIYGPFLKLTRGETAVSLTAPPTLHGVTEPFDLWKAAAA